MGVDFPKVLLVLLLVAVPAIVVIYRRSVLTSQDITRYGGVAPGTRYFTVRHTLIGILFAALAVVAARPFIGYQKTGDYLFVIDVSRSMHARHSCSEPTFLDRAKNAIRTTLTAIPEARFGILAFDRFAFPVTHMTRDQAYLEDVIDHGLYVGLTMEATRTEIANALSVVAGKVERLPEIYGSVKHIVLLSDGHIDGNYRRRMQEPLARLREAGIVISTVGIGNPQETPIVEVSGQECNGVHIEVDGERVLIPLRSDILTFIAAETGGAYYTEAETDALIEMLRSGLESTVVTSGDERANDARKDLSWLFLLLATGALLGILYMPLFPTLRGR